MKKILAITITLVLLTGLVLSVSGCARAAQRTIERAITQQLEREGIEFDKEDESYTVKVEDESGKSEIKIGKAEMPEGFPSKVPVYTNMQITMSNRTKSGDETTFMVWATTQDSGEGIFNWMKNQLSGWDEVSESSWSADDGKGFYVSASIGGWDDDYRLSVDFQVIEYDEETAIIYTVFETQK